MCPGIRNPSPRCPCLQVSLFPVSQLSPGVPHPGDPGVSVPLHPHSAVLVPGVLSLGVPVPHVPAVVVPRYPRPKCPFPRCSSSCYPMCPHPSCPDPGVPAVPVLHVPTPSVPRVLVLAALSPRVPIPNLPGHPGVPGVPASGAPIPQHPSCQSSSFPTTSQMSLTQVFQVS